MKLRVKNFGASSEVFGPEARGKLAGGASHRFASLRSSAPAGRRRIYLSSCAFFIPFHVADGGCACRFVTIMQLLSTPRNFVSGPTPQEKLKVVKDGLDVIHDVYRYAKLGFKAIPEEDFERFKW